MGDKRWLLGSRQSGKPVWCFSYYYYYFFREVSRKCLLRVCCLIAAFCRGFVLHARSFFFFFSFFVFLLHFLALKNQDILKFICWSSGKPALFCMWTKRNGGVDKTPLFISRLLQTPWHNVMDLHLHTATPYIHCLPGFFYLHPPLLLPWPTTSTILCRLNIYI